MTCGYKACAKELFLLLDLMLKLEKANFFCTETLFPILLSHLIQLYPTMCSCFSLSNSALYTINCKPILSLSRGLGDRAPLCPSLWDLYSVGDSYFAFMPKFSSTRNPLSAIKLPLTSRSGSWGWKAASFFSHLQHADSPFPLEPSSTLI